MITMERQQKCKLIDLICYKPKEAQTKAVVCVSHDASVHASFSLKCKEFKIMCKQRFILLNPAIISPVVFVEKKKLTF